MVSWASFEVFRCGFFYVFGIFQNSHYVREFQKATELGRVNKKKHNFEKEEKTSKNDIS